MSWLGRLTKSARYAAGDGLNQVAELARVLGFSTSSNVTVNTTTATDVTAVFCAARVIAEGCAQVPLRIVQAEHLSNGLERRTVRHDHPVHQMLNYRPNEWMTRFEFIEAMVFMAVLGKGAIAIKNRDGSNRVRELLPVPAGSWSVEQMNDWSLRFRVDYSNKSHGYFDRSDVFYLRGPSLNGYEGHPAIRAAREAIGLSLAIERSQARLSGNGAKPSGLLAIKGGLSEQARNNLQDSWNDKYGPNGEGGIAILDREASFQAMTMTSVDAQHIETRRFQVEEIGRAFRVLPIMLMQSDKAMTFASSEQMFRAHVTHTLMPWFVRVEEAIKRDLLTEPGDENLIADFDEKSLMRGDLAAQAEYFTKALGAGGQPAWMTQNEVRAEDGLAPLDTDEANHLNGGAMGQNAGSE